MGSSDETGDHHVPSPFAETEVLPSAPGRKRKSRLWLVILSCAAIAGIAAIAWSFIALNDPLRSLHSFPVDDYFQDYKPLAGSRFRAELTVDADLGWKDGIGKLLVFTAGEDRKPLSVLIPPEISQTYFQKGRTFSVELQVEESGLIVAKQLHPK